jgi:hypothetical protein
MTTTVDKDTDTNRRGRIGETASAARTRASDAYNAARERTSAAYGSARDSASRARERTADGIESNPVAALIGGLALGGLLAAILPKTRREQDLIGDYGRRINDKAREAARAAAEAGKTRLDELGYNRETAREKVQALKSDAAEVAKTAARKVRST